MDIFSRQNPQDLHALRAHLYDTFDWQYRAKSVPPAGLNLLRAAGMIQSATGSLRCNGHIQGTGYGGVKFSLHEVAARRNPDLIDPLTGQPYIAGFGGLLIRVVHHTAFLFRTIVKRDKGRRNPAMVEEMKVVRLVSSEFEALFEVYSDDQVEARALLTPDFMERLMAFDSHPQFKGLQIGFIGNSMYAALPSPERVQFGHSIPFFDAESAANAVKQEIKSVFSLLANMDSLHAAARALDAEGVQGQRKAFYDRKVGLIEDAVAAAMEDGVLRTGASSKWINRDAYDTVDPMLHGLLLPRF